MALSPELRSTETDLTQAKSVNSTLLAEDCRGRVDVTRTFVGRELNTEYLFGLFANLADNPSEFSLLGLPVKYEILHFAANQNIASASTKSVIVTQHPNSLNDIPADQYFYF